MQSVEGQIFQIIYLKRKITGFDILYLIFKKSIFSQLKWNTEMPVNKIYKNHITNVIWKKLKIKTKILHFFLLIVLSLLFGEKVIAVVYFGFFEGSTVYIDMLFMVRPRFMLFFPDIFFKTCWLLISETFFVVFTSLLFFKVPNSALFFLAMSSLTKALLLSIILVIF